VVGISQGAGISRRQTNNRLLTRKADGAPGSGKRLNGTPHHTILHHNHPQSLGAAALFAGTYFLFLAKKKGKTKRHIYETQTGPSEESWRPATFRCSFLFSKVSECGEAKSDSRVNKF